jgi:hypothetical protein
MSSDPSRRAAALSLTTALVALGACGKQGDPMPRPRAIPQAAQDLTLRQRGNELWFSFSYPNVTLAGRPLEGFRTATLFELTRPVPAETGGLVVDVAELEALAQAVVVLESTSLANAITGDQIRLGLKLDAEALAGDLGRAYAVRTETARGDISPWSNIVSIVPRPAPAPPEGLDVRPASDGVEIHWKPAEGAAGYAVLRREATDPDWGAPLAVQPADVVAYLDRSALYGTRYIYTVVALASDDPPIESLPVNEREVDYRDLFPPPPPRDLRAVSLPGEVRLVWEAASTADLVGCFVERSLDGGTWTRLNDFPVTGLEYSDATAPPSGVVFYRLIAVDRAGNEAPPSAPVETTRR